MVLEKDVLELLARVGDILENEDVRQKHDFGGKKEGRKRRKSTGSIPLAADFRVAKCVLLCDGLESNECSPPPSRTRAEFPLVTRIRTADCTESYNTKKTLVMLRT
ncbi:hypothetical protein TNIN_299041 [Trichonephila inaurata madagascariensis]|uniref:Uncharacterized protein n=1 Tax=Trichonephila inaurata madagascariensis TaxID=2747483 RepID=A0A8X7CDL5_9ARAC|nr:hypothetical protein TNIN_299041 [Trichonephila inaurata madagascariensis]